jgi:hypothetical protein
LLKKTNEINKIINIIEAVIIGGVETVDICCMACGA